MAPRVSPYQLRFMQFQFNSNAEIFSNIIDLNYDLPGEYGPRPDYAAAARVGFAAAPTRTEVYLLDASGSRDRSSRRMS